MSIICGPSVPRGLKSRKCDSHFCAYTAFSHGVCDASRSNHFVPALPVVPTRHAPGVFLFPIVDTSYLRHDTNGDYRCNMGHRHDEVRTRRT
jgi:hypothetical protein